MLRAMDYLCPTDEELRAMTDEELLGPLERPTVDDLAGRYPIMLGEVPLEEAEAWGFCLATEDIFDFERHCYIDLEHRTVVHGSGCRCIVPPEVLVDCARKA